uniref:Uncharacterized protein n=1 Tax=Setaria italica TaxID=4555 RepID=K4AHJ5_SETIT
MPSAYVETIQLYESMMECSITSCSKENVNLVIFCPKKAGSYALSLDLFWPMLFFADTTRVLAYLLRATNASHHTI